MTTFAARAAATLLVAALLLSFTAGCSDKTATPENKEQTTKRQSIIDQRKTQE